MKRIKGAYEAIKLRYLLFIFAIASLIVLPLRVYQLLALIDAETGFYVQESGTVPLLSAILILVVGAFIALSFVSKEVPSPRLPEGKNVVLGVTSAILGFSFIVNAFSVLFDIIPPRSSMVIFADVLKSNIDAAGGIFVILQLIFAIRKVSI